MVSTRHSLPNVAAVNPSQDDPNVPKELRRLHINGKDTMRGAKVEKPKPQKKKKNVYHWRGAVYAITKDTPQEWIDQEPEKFKRRRSNGDEEAATKKSLKRKSTSALDHTSHNDDGDESRPSKRARRNTMHHVPATSSRLRKSLTTKSLDTTSTRPRRTSTKPTAPAEDNDSTLKFDFRLSNHQRILSDIEAQKEAAREKGYNVDMMSAKEMKQAKELRDAQPATASTVGAKLVRDIAKMAKLNDAIASLSQKYERAKEQGIFKAILARKAARLGRRTTQSRVQVHDEDEEDDEAEVVDLDENGHPLRQIPTIEVEPGSDDLAGDDLRLADGLADAVDRVYDERDTQSQIESQLNDELNDEDEDPLSLPANIRDTRTRSESEDSSADHSSKRQDSATNTTSPDLAPSSHTTPIEEGGTSRSARKTSPAAYLAKLPGKNRGGQEVRWTMKNIDKAKGISKEERYASSGRAEGLIHKGRLNGESKNARRRRVTREMKFLESWPVDNGEN
ncbi:hypothetical protein PRZ48_008758 [Zasmidium cellare]|uniref:Uncharacterized protein n=1 Tax=Zasmidium cellare TaxID=395010 RepID=A0ABR0EGC5_ZASCE|nr:hypothetical protein PRZ48_008758 [Zasmidium cellare]